MIKVTESKFIDYPEIRLFLEDVNRLIDIFFRNFDVIEVVIDGYRILDYSKIAEIKKPFVTELTIEGKPDYGKKDHDNRRMSLTLRYYKRTLYLSDEDDVILLGIASQIDDLLKKRMSKTRLLNYDWIPISICVLVDLLILLFSHYYHFPEAVLYSLLFGLPALILLTWYVLHLRYHKKRVRIYLIDSNSRTGFFERKKDDLLVGLIGAIAGSILTVIVTVIIEHLANPKP